MSPLAKRKAEGHEATFKRNHMKNTLAIISLLIATVAQAQNLTDRLAGEFRDAHWRVHVTSMHVPRTSTNNNNIGFGVKTKSGFLAGRYYNSYFLWGSYVGWESPEWIPRLALDFLLIEGYQHISGMQWTPGIAPNIRVTTLTRSELKSLGLSFEDASLRLLIVPKHDQDQISVGLYHLGLEVRY